MTMIQHRDTRRQFADLFDWAEGLPSLFTMPAMMRGVRIEEFSDDDKYVVRAERPAWIRRRTSRSRSRAGC